MDIDFIFKILMIIVFVGIAIKTIKFIGGLIFKVAFVALIFILIIKFFV